MICDRCGKWIHPVVDYAQSIATCTFCGYRNPRRFLPLFVVTGASGTGKTAAVPELRKLPEAFIRDQQGFRQWFLDHSETAFDPPLVTADTTSVSPASTAQEIRDWALSCQIGHSYNQE